MAPFSSSPDPIAREKVPLVPDFINALLLVKSKPAGIPCRDYLLQLRSCIRDEPRPVPTKSPRRHVDATAYWRDAYTKLEELYVASQAKVDALELRIAAFEQTKVAAPVVASSQRKRKREANEPLEASSSRETKHARTTRSNIPDPAKFSASDEALVTLMDAIDSSDSPGNGFQYHLYVLQQLLKETWPDPQTLASTLCQISCCVCRLVSNVQAVGDSYSEDATRQLLTVGQLFPCILKALERLNRPPGIEPRVPKGKIILSFVKIFIDVLERICDLSATQAQQTPTSMPTHIADRAHNLQHTIAIVPGFPAASGMRASCHACNERRLKCDGGLPDCRNCRDGKRECKRGVPLHFTKATTTNALFTPPTENILRLCEFAIVLMARLDTTKSTHEEIREGFMFFLLQKLGQGLRTFSIGPEHEWEVGGHEAQADEGSRQLGEAQEVNEAQAPYLVWIFEQALAFTGPTHLARSSSNAGPSTSTREPLLALEQRRFQNTMLRAMFGDGVSADYSPTLTPPSSPLDRSFFDRLAGELQTGETGIKDWYKHEVWRLVSWDCLKEKLQWDNI